MDGTWNKNGIISISTEISKILSSKLEKMMKDVSFESHLNTILNICYTIRMTVHSICFKALLKTNKKLERSWITIQFLHISKMTCLSTLERKKDLHTDGLILYIIQVHNGTREIGYHCTYRPTYDISMECLTCRS